MSRRLEDAEDPRRAFLLKALAAGLLAWSGTAPAQLFGRRTPPFSLFDEDYGGARRY